MQEKKIFIENIEKIKISTMKIVKIIKVEETTVILTKLKNITITFLVFHGCPWSGASNEFSPYLRLKFKTSN